MLFNNKMLLNPWKSNKMYKINKWNIFHITTLRLLKFLKSNLYCMHNRFQKVNLSNNKFNLSNKYRTTSSSKKLSKDLRSNTSISDNKLILDLGMNLTKNRKLLVYTADLVLMQVMIINQKQVSQINKESTVTCMDLIIKETVHHNLPNNKLLIKFKNNKS